MQPIVTRKAASHPHARVKRARRQAGPCAGSLQVLVSRAGPRVRDPAAMQPCKRVRVCAPCVCAGARFVHVRVLVC